ncbi:MAG: NAD(P)/FAD-dependent oxidoreductase [Rubrivivax sp.]|nr:MAG: NAD(P)/FAD-dependent oxidoreductase [Rubrivivax sp.]
MHRIVVVGGGAGGLELAARLGDDLGRKGRAEVLLIDETMVHVWKPLLHEVAAGTLPDSVGSVDFLQQARRHGFRFHLGSMASLDRPARQVWLAPLLDEQGGEIAPRRPIPYDTLVIAVGSVVNDFGTRGVREHAMALNDAAEAERFHRRLLAECARAELQGGGPVEIAIVGGGATGVELAAELVETIREIASYGMHLRDLPQPVHVRVIESGDRLVGALPEQASASVQADMEAAGVEVMLRQRVTEVASDHVLLADGRRLPAHITVWAAGIQGAGWLRELGLQTNRQGQLVVHPTLQTLEDDAIFAMGDCASCQPSPSEKPVPPRAQAAHQEAMFLAGALSRRLKGRPLPAFAFRDRGSLVSLGRRNAVGSITQAARGRHLLLEGWSARVAYWFLYRQHLATLHGVVRTVLMTIGGWLTSRSHTRVKLH